MTALKIYFYLILLLSCENVNKKNANSCRDNITLNKDSIVIVGIASDCKAGATIVSENDQKRYYLEGIDYWDETIVGKKVKVSGKLFIEDLKEEVVKNGEIIPQQMIGVKRTILNPTWELVR
jgi:hypothetical protein